MARYWWATSLSTAIVSCLLPIQVFAASPTTANLLDRLAALEAKVASLTNQLASESATRQAADTALSDSISAGDANMLTLAKGYTDAQLPESDSFVTSLKTYMTVDTTNDRITLTGVNLQLTNGAPIINGKGNLIIGNDPPRTVGPWNCSHGAYTNKVDCEAAGYVWALSHKSGSHNLVIGDGHNYSSVHGIVAGTNNTINGDSATVLGGYANRAFGDWSSICGGNANTAAGQTSSVSGGYGNWATAESSSVSGGYMSKASGNYSSVTGGSTNFAIAESSSVSGGEGNQAKGAASNISGGYLLTADTQYQHLP